MSALKTWPWAKIGQSVFSLALTVGCVGWLIPYVAQTTWHGIFYRLGQVPSWTLPLFVTVMLCGLIMNAICLGASVPGLTRSRAIRVDLAGSAIANAIPLGGAVAVGMTYGMLRSFGFSRAAIGNSVLTTSVVNFSTKLMLPILAFGVVTVAHVPVHQQFKQFVAIGSAAAVVLLGLFAGIVASRRVAHGVGMVVGSLVNGVRRVLRKAPADSIEERIQEFRLNLVHLISNSWGRMYYGSFGMLFVQSVLFWMVCTTLHINLTWPATFAAFAIGRLAASVPITPAGAGVTESAVIATLVSMGAMHTNAAAAAVLYSLVAVLMEIPFGAICIGEWLLRRGRLVADAKARVEAATARAEQLGSPGAA
ncbi:flippase-like domain-containing protein [Micrococcales bacterium 31B]|nr:flippase-like domain-containing protein [Micrococcales bacterium 31B]